MQQPGHVLITYVVRMPNSIIIPIQRLTGHVMGKVMGRRIGNLIEFSVMFSSFHSHSSGMSDFDWQEAFSCHVLVRLSKEHGLPLCGLTTNLHGLTMVGAKTTDT